MSEKLYTVNWDKTSGTVPLGGYDVPLPEMPPLETMENYGLDISDQKFKRTKIPATLLKKKPIIEDSEEEEFIKGEYHKIHNGTWILIKGIPIYLTGAYYFFLNYWTTNQGKKPDFKYIQCLLFLFWEMVVRNKKLYGLFLVKPRRIGGTEITISWLYADVLRYRNMVCGMQSKNEDSVFKNYRRVLNAHKNMIWFMKPINQGSTGNKDGLFLRYPEEQQTAKKLKEAAENGEKESSYEDPEINSDLTYQPSVATAYDGERLDRYILNEFGKCLAKGTRVMMYSGEIRVVEDIQEGDVLMGEDGTPRVVKTLIYGNGELYKITPKAKGWDSWSCGINHILSLKYCANNYSRWKKGEIVDISISEFLELPRWVQGMFCLYRGQADFEEKQLIERKKVQCAEYRHLNSRDSNKTCFTIEKCEDGSYYGFEIEGENKRHLLEDMQVVHNCEKMSVLDCWDKVKPCLHLDNGETITGKAVFESTIEEMNDDQISELVDFWNDSNMDNLDENGRTVSGLIRLFISATDAAKEDEWGFPKSEETLAFLEKQFAALRAAGKTKELANLKRKVPLVIEDALTPSGDQCSFNKENLQEALSDIDFPIKGREKPAVRGNLMWDNGNFNGRVIFEPNPEGRWCFSMLAGPNTYQDNKVGYIGPDRVPGNINKIRIGIDPYDHKEVVDNRKSKGGAVGGIMYDDLKDGAKVGEDGKPIDLGLEWETHQPIFTYYYRQPDPQDFFEDMLMSAVYCGAPVLFENNKQSIRNHFVNRGYKAFIMTRPEGTMTADQRKGVITDGIPASENTIQQYYDAIDTYVSRNARSIKLRDLIVDLLGMNRKNHGKHDLGVAFGWLLIAMTKKYPMLKESSEEEKEEWFEVYEV